MRCRSCSLETSRLSRRSSRGGRGPSASPIASVNLWLDRRMLAGAVSRTAWPDDAVGLRQGAGVRSGTSHLTLVSSGADDVMAMQNDELIALALRELREALPEARAAKVLRAVVFASGERRSRWRRASRRGPATRTNVAALCSPATGSTPACPLRSKARRSAAAARPRRLHELRRRSLSGDRAQGTQPAVVYRRGSCATSGRRPATSTCGGSFTKMGRIEVVLGSARRVGCRSPSGCAACSGSPIFRGRRSCRSTSTPSRTRSSTISAICRSRRSASLPGVPTSGFR